ncbi:MAG: hypothetical protein KY393_06370 [Actinobacteria bacterium]|nr:hypothetical protein [Actinomycetota bacterium]
MEPGALLFWLLVLAGVVVLIRYRKRPNTSGLFIGGPPRESIRRITARMVRDGYAIAYRDEGTATFTRSKKPDLDLTVLLLILGIIPGLLYIGLHKGVSTTTVTAIEDDGGSEIILSGDDHRALDGLARWIRSPAAN